MRKSKKRRDPARERLWRAGLGSGRKAACRFAPIAGSTICRRRRFIFGDESWRGGTLLRRIPEPCPNDRSPRSRGVSEHAGPAGRSCA